MNMNARKQTTNCNVRVHTTTVWLPQFAELVRVSCARAAQEQSVQPVDDGHAEHCVSCVLRHSRATWFKALVRYLVPACQPCLSQHACVVVVAGTSRQCPARGRKATTAHGAALVACSHVCPSTSSTAALLWLSITHMRAPITLCVLYCNLTAAGRRLASCVLSSMPSQGLCSSDVKHGT